MVAVRVNNEFFELCMRDPDHPYRERQCDKKCPTWELCKRGEWLDREMVLLVDAGSLDELNELSDELHARGFKVWAEFREPRRRDGGG